MGHTDPLTRRPLRIADYGLVGDGRTAALVDTDGSVDWWCRPRFDSPAVFCRLLDRDRGGHCRVGPAGRYRSSRRYVGPTGVLETIFEAAEGAIRVTDLLVAHHHSGSRLLRLVEGLAGSVDVEVAFDPTFDYARHPTIVSLVDGGAVASEGDHTLGLVGPVELRTAERGARGIRSVARGEHFWLALADDADPRLLAKAPGDLERTLIAHRAWVGAGGYDGPYAEAVERSAITLLLLTHGPTGAPVAAPTTSLPEHPGGVRNWDYRYTWLRDATLGLSALQHIGHHAEAMAFWHWIASRSAEATAAGLQIAYRVDGGTDLGEEQLDHLAGFADARPVRVGNAAAAQRQHDVAGTALDAALYCYEHMRDVDHPFESMARLADAVCTQWRAPDRGIWEVRDAPRHFLHSKLYAWVALDRAVRLAAAAGVDGDVASWRHERDQVAAAILRYSIDSSTGSFTRAFGTDALDATALAVPLVGFLPADDPRVTATVVAVRGQLEENGLLLRYVDDDGLPGREGAFLPCTFWLAEVLSMRGDHDDAHETFERAAGCANDVGLLAEEADTTTGDALGNFPQAFSHLALIKAAVRLAACR